MRRSLQAPKQRSDDAAIRRPETAMVRRAQARKTWKQIWAGPAEGLPRCPHRAERCQTTSSSTAAAGGRATRLLSNGAASARRAPHLWWERVRVTSWLMALTHASRILHAPALT